MQVGVHLGLHKEPLSLTIDPSEAFISAAFREARDQLLNHLHQGARLVALCGAPGMGKTLLLREVERTIRGEGGRVLLLDRGDMADSNLFADQDLVLIDEADHVDDAMLANIVHHASDPARPAVVLASVTSCFDRVRGPLQPHVVTIGPITRADARALILDRVAAAGGDAARFTPEALNLLVAGARGSPRLLITLANNAIVEAAVDGAQQIGTGHVRQAIAMHAGPTDAAPEPEPEPESEPPLPLGPAAFEPVEPSDDLPEMEPDSPRSKRAMILAGIVAALAAAGLWLMQPTSTRSEAPATTAAAPVPADSARAAEPPPPAPAPTPAPAPAPTPTPPQEQQAQQVRPSPAADAAPEPQQVPQAPARRPDVVVRYADNLPGAADAAQRVADVLRAHDYNVVAMRSSSGDVGEASARYFSSGQRDAAEAVNRILSQALQAYAPGTASSVIDMSGSGDAAGEEVIELWVPDAMADAGRPLRLDAPPS